MNTMIPATEKQVAYATKLADGADTDDQARAAMLDAIPSMSKSEISILIDGLKQMPKRQVPGQAPQVDPEEVLAEGLYVSGGQVFKLQRSKKTSRLYALELDPDTGKFGYAKGAVFRLAESGAQPATIEDAIEFGLKTGVCACCGRHLTDENSIAAGIGPVCARRQFGVTPKQLRQRAQAQAA